MGPAAMGARISVTIVMHFYDNAILILYVRNSFVQYNLFYSFGTYVDTYVRTWSCTYVRTYTVSELLKMATHLPVSP